jgi:hypothetical protein
VDGLKQVVPDIAASFKGSNLLGVILSDAQLTLSDFSDAELFAVIADNADFSRAKFKGARITLQSSNGADFSEADFSGAQFITVFDNAFNPKSKELKRGDEVVRLIGGSVDKYDADRQPCYAWAVREHAPGGIPDNFAIILVDREEDGPRQACTNEPEKAWIAR